MIVHASLSMLLVASASAAAELSPTDFAFGAPVRTDERASAYRITLPIDVYRETIRADLGDLCVFNVRGEVVPYEVQRPQTEASTKQPPVRLPTFALRGDPGKALNAMRVTIESGRASVDVGPGAAQSSSASVSGYIVDARSLNTAISALQLEWPEDATEFAGRLSIEASDDLRSWRSVMSDVPVANLRADTQRLIERRADFPATRAKFWRLSWAGNAAPFTLTGVVAEPAESLIELQRSSIVKDGSRVPGKPDEFAFDLGARLPVDRINVALPEPNSIVQLEILSRAVVNHEWRLVTRHPFYRLNGENGELRNGEIAIPVTPDRYWLVRLQKAGSLGRGIPRLHAEWFPHELVFLARGEGPFMLAFGSAGAEPSAVTLTSVLPNVRVASARLDDAVELGGRTRLQPPPEPFPWKSAALWAVLVLGVGVLAWMAYRLSREMGSSSAHSP